MKKVFWISYFVLCFSFSVAHAQTSCPPGTTEGENCWSCGSDCVAYLTAIKDENGQDVRWSCNGKTEYPKKLIVTGEGKMTDYTAPYATPWVVSGAYITDIDVSGVSSIGDYAFYGMSGLKNISLSEGIVSMGYMALVDHPDLTNIELPQSLQSMGYGALGRNSFNRIVLPDNLKHLGGDVFGFNSNNIELFLPESLLSAENGVSIYTLRFANLATLYCPENHKNKCETLLQNAGKQADQINSILKTYEKSDHEYFYDGKFYASLTDIAERNYMKKRSYTPAEAAKVVGNNNTIIFHFK